jgi:hypothetical protein
VTSPAGTGSPEVGTAWVTLTPSANGFARKMKAELEKEFAKVNLDDLVQRAFSNRPIEVPVRAVMEDVQTRPLVAPVDVDVDTSGVRRRLQAAVEVAARRVKAEVKVDVDTGRSGGLTQLPSTLSGVAAAFRTAAGSALNFGGSVAGVASSASGPLGAVASAAVGLSAAIVGIAGAVAVGAPALTALAGAAAAIPGVMAGAAAAIGALSLGFSGIADAFKPAAGGGGGGGGEDPASRARRIAGAERAVEAARRGIASANRTLQAAERGLVDAQLRVADAQKRAKLAQEAVNRARREATEDLEDLNRALRGARLDEESAALAVTEALRELNAAREQGNLPDIQRADLAYRQSLLTLEQAKDTTQDLGEEQADAAKKGVEGSDKVQDALRDQSDAFRAVRDAQQGVLDAQNAVLSANDGLKSSYDGLASAQDSLAEAQKKVAAGGGAAADEMVKLAPNAQKFVDAVKALKPAFDDLRLDVQNKLFKGLDVTVTDMWKAWQGQLRTTLGSWATSFNTFFRNLGAAVSQPKFISDIAAGADGLRKGFDAIGKSVTDKLVPALGSLAKAGGPFLEALGEELAGVVTSFSDWVTAGERSGKLQSFFDNATQAMRDIFDIGGTVTSIIGNLFEIITGKQSDSDKTPLQAFNDRLQAVNRWLNDPANQQKVRGFITDVQNGVTKMIEFVDKVDRFADKVAAVWNEVDQLGTKISNVLGGFTPDGTKPLGEAMWEGIKQGFTDGWNATKDFVAELIWKGDNSLVGRIKRGLGIQSPSTVMASVGREVVNGLIKGIGDRFAALVDRAKQLPGRIRAGIGNAANILYTHGRNVVVGLANGALSYYNRLRTWVGQLRGAITGALSNAGSMLWNAGRDTVIGLWNGISSLGGWLWNKVTNYVRDKVKNAFTFGLELGSPSKMTYQMGRYVSQGLALGIEAEAGLVSDAADRIAAAAMPDVASPYLGASSLSSLQPARMVIAVEGTGDWLVDGLRRNISVRYQGDPVAALGGR